MKRTLDIDIVTNDRPLRELLAMLEAGECDEIVLTRGEEFAASLTVGRASDATREARARWFARLDELTAAMPDISTKRVVGAAREGRQSRGRVNDEVSRRDGRAGRRLTAEEKAEWVAEMRARSAGLPSWESGEVVAEVRAERERRGGVE